MNVVIDIIQAKNSELERIITSLDKSCGNCINYLDFKDKDSINKTLVELKQSKNYINEIAKSELQGFNTITDYIKVINDHMTYMEKECVNL